MKLRCGHLDLYMNNLEDILKTLDDSDTVYFLEIDLKYPDNKKNKEFSILS